MSDRNEEQFPSSPDGKPSQTPQKDKPKQNAGDCDCPDEVCMALIVIGLVAIAIYYIGYGLYWLGRQLYWVVTWPFRTERAV